MKITHYSFGKITINGKTYSSDVIIFPERINASWWRQEGHVLNIADLKDIIYEGLPLLIVGIGFYGAMKVPQETLDYLTLKKIEVHVANTGEAVKFFNEIASQKPCVAALHLTC